MATSLYIQNLGIFGAPGPFDVGASRYVKRGWVGSSVSKTRVSGSSGLVVGCRAAWCIYACIEIMGCFLCGCHLAGPSVPCLGRARVGGDLGGARRFGSRGLRLPYHITIDIVSS